jgi:hypothetical protein
MSPPGLPFVEVAFQTTTRFHPHPLFISFHSLLISMSQVKTRKHVHFVDNGVGSPFGGLLNTVLLDGVGTGNESRVDEFFSNDKKSIINLSRINKIFGL